MSLQDAAEEYFSKLNPIAARLCTDMNETKIAYEKLWINFTQEERDQILNETIIKPEAMLQYSSMKIQPKKVEEYAVKLIIDDHFSYPDEHSAPFSFRTPSQRDLTVFSQSEVLYKPQVPVRLKKEKSVDLVTKIILLDDSSAVDTLPKTGLDLLDNW